MAKRRCFSLLLLLLPLKIWAQDAIFTQFYASPLTLNPAFAGTAAQYRFSSIYRYQWVNQSAGFQTNTAAFD